MSANNSPRQNHSIDERKKLGAYYTPAELTRILAEWSIDTPKSLVLEPSFGGCGFLKAASDRLLELGSSSPKTQLYGCDIDPIAFSHLARMLGGPVDLHRFVQADFLDVENRAEWPEKFNTIIGNPPYISYQSISNERRAELSRRSWEIQGVGGRASLWAYFLTHSISHLTVGGKMAWVLPGAILQAQYADPIRGFLSSSFKRTVAFVMEERLFLEAGADEESVVLLCDGYRQSGDQEDTQLAYAHSVPDLERKISDWDKKNLRGVKGWQSIATIGNDIQESDAYKNLSANSFIRRTGDLLKVQIGLVTGANHFFVLTSEGLEENGLQPEDCKPILAKFAASKGLQFDLDTHSIAVLDGFKGYLIDSDREPSNIRVKRYLSTFKQDDIGKIGTFKKRAVWSKTDDGNIPDAFFPVMHQNGPRLVLNPDDLSCTNTIHRVYFNEGTTKTHTRLTAISILTSFSQISAEFVGRRYGSGVLKHEPREAEKISLLMPEINPQKIRAAFNRIDRTLKKGDEYEAMLLADQFIYEQCGVGDPTKTSDQLSSMLEAIRRLRVPERKR